MLCGIANFGTVDVATSLAEPVDPVELSVPVLLDPILCGGGIELWGGGIGGGTIMPLAFAVLADAAKLPSS